MSPIDVVNSPRPRGGRGMRYALLLLFIVIAGGTLWTWLTLAWGYSDGTRAGILQRYSHRGWVCRTQEGDLAQYIITGVSPQIWQFSVRDPAIGAQLEKVVGSRVQLHYTEHPGVPSSCFAETRYFVDRVTVIDGGPSIPGGALPSTAAPAPSAPATPALATPASPATPAPVSPEPPASSALH